MIRLSIYDIVYRLPKSIVGVDDCSSIAWNISTESTWARGFNRLVQFWSSDDTHQSFVCFLDCFFPVLFCLVDFDCFRVSLLFQFQLMISSSIASYTLIESSRERWFNWLIEPRGSNDPLYYTIFSFWIFLCFLIISG